MGTKLLIVSVIVMLLRSCDGAGPQHSLPPPVQSAGFVDILPTPAIKVGRIYFAGEGRRPAFATPAGTIYNEVCYDDFRLTAALANISEDIVEEGAVQPERSASRTLGGSVAGGNTTLARLAQLTFSGRALVNSTYTLTNIRRFGLTDRGLTRIRANLGADCKAEILALQARTSVVLILQALRADSATDVTGSNFGGSVGASLGGTATAQNGTATVTGDGLAADGGVQRSATSSGAEVYIAVALDQFAL